ncbi:MAG TPA: hypothetical protein VK447_10730 [Myxococcaceae bacterium]|nr:hypothetical protein [Myxococcaceae bacterium]
MRTARVLLGTLLLGALPALAQDRPSEDQLFGAPSAQEQKPAAPAAPQQEPKEGSTTGSPPASGTRDEGQPNDRPDEDALFGGGDTGTPAAETGAPAPKTEPGGTPERDREDAAMAGGAKDAFESGEGDPEDPLKIGGTFYLRTFGSLNQGAKVSEGRFSAPTLVDAYFDARPNDRVRGMLVARLNYDPTLGAGGGSFLPGLPAASTNTISNPAVGIDQLWLRFDIARTVFVTAGRQHVRWGVGRVWTPTDYLTPQRRDPLAPFDQRLGASMLKLHVPWEAQGWNFYAVGLFDQAFATAGQTTAGGSGTSPVGSTNNAPTTPSTNAGLLGALGGATRAEIVIGHTEVGVDAVFQPGRKPRFGVDLSSALGPIDIYADVGFHQGGDRELWRFTSGAYDPALPYATQVEPFRLGGTILQAAGGASYTLVYNDNDTLTFGGEYFYNSLGYEDADLYPWLLFTGNYQAFYTGKHYAALVATLLAPGNWDKTTFNLSTIANLSDMSFVTRLDFFVRVLTYLQVEAFAAVHYGRRGGEFRFALDVPAQPVAPNVTIPAIHLPPPLVDFGVALRMNL